MRSKIVKISNQNFRKNMKKIPKGAGRIILSFRILKFFILIIHPACASDMVPVEMLPSLLRAVPAKPLRNLKF